MERFVIFLFITLLCIAVLVYVVVAGSNTKTHCNNKTLKRDVQTIQTYKSSWKCVIKNVSYDLPCYSSKSLPTTMYCWYDVVVENGSTTLCPTAIPKNNSVGYVSANTKLPSSIVETIKTNKFGIVCIVVEKKNNKFLIHSCLCRSTNSVDFVTYKTTVDTDVEAYNNANKTSFTTLFLLYPL